MGKVQAFEESKSIRVFEKLNNGLAKTPPMGWSSWNQFGVEINEKLIIETIDSMVTNGMRDAGYIYVNLDDGWQQDKGKRQNKPLDYDQKKFPKGIKYLSDYAHKNGMKLGIYSGPGETTCAGFAGSEGHAKADAELFASWDIDHLKYDSCCSHKDASEQELKNIFYQMSKPLIDNPKDIVLHACHCGWQKIWEWAGDLGANHWRIGQDISDDFDYPENREGYYFDVLDMLDRGNGLEEFNKPGQWNDFDMLIVGLNGESKELVGAGASNVEYRAHFSLWSILSTPLLTGTDVRNLDAYTLETLTNKEIIALNQDSLGEQAKTVKKVGNIHILAKPMSDGSWAVAMLNRGSETESISVDWLQDLGLDWDDVQVRDLWKRKDMGVFSKSYQYEVISHQAVMLRLYPTK
jgi:alpha-galactosidase